VLFQLATAIIAAIAWGQLIQVPSASIQSAANLWCLPIASLVFAGVSWIFFPEQWYFAPLMLVGTLLMAIAVALVNACATGRRWAPLALILLTAADLAAYGLSYAVLPGTSDLNQFASVALRPPLPGGGRIVADDRDGAELRMGNQMLLAGYARADGYAGLEPRSIVGANDNESLREANVLWLRAGSDWRRVTSSRERIRCDDPATAISVVTDAPGRLTLRIKNRRSTRMTFAERFHTGWHATLDGADIPVIRSGNFMACEIPTGCHKLEMRFRPASLRFGGLLTLCGLSLTLSWAAIAMLAPRQSA
jgi:hypothetical protein